MKKIEFFPSIFTAEETNTMAKQCDTAIVAVKSTDEILLLAKDALVLSNERLTRVMNAILANPYTVRLGIADDLRDGVYVGGRNVIEGFTHWTFDNAKKEAADRLIEVIYRNGWSLQAYGYSKQSSAMNSLINEYRKPELQADLATVGLQNWFAELVKSQEAFETVFNQKAGAQNNKESVEKKEAQIPVNEDIEKLVTYLNSIVMFKTDNAAWNNLFNDIEGIVKQMTAVARTRRSNQKPINVKPNDKPVEPKE